MAHAERAGGRRFLDPHVLARIADLELVARTVVEGFTSGLHRSPYLGLSLDFAEHRPYMPGDDLRRIDWRLFGRTDRHYVKEFEADSNADCVLLLDVSRSMSYASRGVSKLDYGRTLAACLAYLAAHRQRDRVGLATFDHELVDFVPPSAKHLDPVLQTLERAVARGRGELAAPLNQVAEACRRRGIRVLISDLYEEPQRVIEAARTLAGGRSDLIVFHLLDPAELEFPFEEAAAYEDLESGERLSVVPERVREQYRRLVTEHVESLARLFGQDRMDYARIDTRTPLELALYEFLFRREQRVRRR